MYIKKVGAYEAKTHLSSLLDSAANGEKTIITKKGTPIAILIPYEEEKMSVHEAIQELLKFKKVPLKGLSIKNMKEEGRKF